MDAGPRRVVALGHVILFGAWLLVLLVIAVVHIAAIEVAAAIGIGLATWIAGYAAGLDRMIIEWRRVRKQRQQEN